LAGARWHPLDLPQALAVVAVDHQVCWRVMMARQAHRSGLCVACADSGCEPRVAQVQVLQARQRISPVRRGRWRSSRRSAAGHDAHRNLARPQLHRSCHGLSQPPARSAPCAWVKRLVRQHFDVAGWEGEVELPWRGDDHAKVAGIQDDPHPEQRALRSYHGG